METQTILVGSDLTDTSDAALAHALKVAPRLGARVLLVHVVERTEVPRGKQSGLEHAEKTALRKVIDWQLASAEHALARQVRRVTGKKTLVACDVRVGKPSVELLSLAKRRRAGLVVLGMAEQTGGPGHVAQRVLSATEIPILIVPSSNFDSLRRSATVTILPRRPRQRAMKRRAS